ncbi:protein of unknown function [Friedmanniella luteola]|uniref:DUF1707 domain-containing protein n=1 Tax=Friedmanniella luteola TaxID=546871 RepID=A0A1H1NSY8_9ACTN|nr:DUF1707 domain-containing protein [Friedmanniella luteola]SDS02087.1 protein of unknown function [Friedmanniella luteola]
MDPSHALTARPSTALAQRAGDTDRSAVCDELSAHFAAGRLREDELDARLGAAVHATTLLELRRLTADLPATPPAPGPSPRVGARPAWTALDVVALLAVVGCLGLAALLMLALTVGGAGGMAALGFLGGSVAAVGGASLAHLVHRGWARAQAAAERDAQRPRIA